MYLKKKKSFFSFYIHCNSTNHTSNNCWIKHGYPPNYHQKENKTTHPKLSVSVVDYAPTVTDDTPVVTNDHNDVQHGFSKEHYATLLALIQQSRLVLPY